MSAEDRVKLSIEQARLIPERKNDLDEMIQHLFNRRSLATLDLWNQLRHGAEINAFLRRRSSVYKSLSSEKEGPLLFGLGYLQIRGEELTVTSSEVPGRQIDEMCQVLSEFVYPGATFTIGSDAGQRTLHVKGVGQLQGE